MSYLTLEQLTVVTHKLTILLKLATIPLQVPTNGEIAFQGIVTTIQKNTRKVALMSNWFKLYQVGVTHFFQFRIVINNRLVVGYDKT